MPRIYQLTLEDYERMTLIKMRDHHPTAYVRVRSAALLKVMDGEPIHQVAQAGLLRRHEWEMVARWVKSYQQQKLGRLYVQKGKGRKPVFSLRVKPPHGMRWQRSGHLTP